ncbi:hypothetical protein [Rosistilla oblonga]|uniref:hypothetical protein n=1 Tax=Rosistilla oblonga TaxID=2527990 RepID=UPI003A978681
MTNSSATVESQVTTIDRRRDDRRTDADQVVAEAAAKPAQRKKQRRRQIDPTTCERDYSDKEIEFMHALDEYKRNAGRMFPTCSEVLEVIRGLGYVQLTDEQAAMLQTDEFDCEEDSYGQDSDDDEFADLGDEA